jgi:hypothetical protein
MAASPLCTLPDPTLAAGITASTPTIVGDKGIGIVEGNKRYGTQEVNIKKGRIYPYFCSLVVDKAS